MYNYILVMNSPRVVTRIPYITNMTKKSAKKSAQTIIITKKKPLTKVSKTKNIVSIPSGGVYNQSSKKGRINRGNLNSHPIFGSDNYVSNCNSVPAAFINFEGNSTFCRETGAVKHPFLGVDGLSLVGCQPLTDINTDGTTSGVFTANSLATIASSNLIFISPDIFNGPLAAQANLHQQYVFRDVLIEYVSNVATTQAGSLAMAIVTDGSAAGASGSFSTTRQNVPSMVCPFRTDRAYLHYHYDGLNTWYTLTDSTSNASKRLTNQGTIIGYPSASSLGAISQGFTNLWYVVELYQPVSTQGFTMGLRSFKEYSLVREFVKSLRIDDSDEHTERVGTFWELVNGRK
jgi:hypothetical protein